MARQRMPSQREIRRWLALLLMERDEAPDPRLAGLESVSIADIPHRDDRMTFGPNAVRSLTDKEIAAAIRTAWNKKRR